MQLSKTALEAEPCRFGSALQDARLVALLLHGRTQTPQDMFDHVVARLALHDVAYLAPLAPGNSWYPARFMEPTAANQPALGDALARLQTLSRQLAQQGIGLERQVVMGFSQGACLACEFVWRQAQRFAALISFTGGLIGPPGTTWPAAPGRFGGMPVLLTGRDQDPWVPLARTTETLHAFKAAGAQAAQQTWPGSEHEIADAEIALARKLLG